MYVLTEDQFRKELGTALNMSSKNDAEARLAQLERKIKLEKKKKQVTPADRLVCNLQLNEVRAFLDTFKG